MKDQSNKYLQPPRGFFDLQWMRNVTKFINALRNGKMTNGRVLYGDTNTLWDNSGGGTGQMTYKGEWSAGGTYAVQNIVTRGVLGEFIAVQAPPAGTAPETGAPYWHAWQYPPPGVWQ